MQISSVVIVCGKICSGKTSLINMLTQTFGGNIISFGLMVKEKLIEKNRDISRTNLQGLGYHLFKTMSSRDLINEAIKYAKINSNIVYFDGVRHPNILFELQKLYVNNFVIYLKISEAIRFERYRSKYAMPDLSLDEFRTIDNHPIEIGTDLLEKNANIVLDSAGPIEFNKLIGSLSKKLKI
jgi:dephospho-CoA kinase